MENNKSSNNNDEKNMNTNCASNDNNEDKNETTEIKKENSGLKKQIKELETQIQQTKRALYEEKQINSVLSERSKVSIMSKIISQIDIIYDATNKINEMNSNQQVQNKNLQNICMIIDMQYKKLLENLNIEIINPKKGDCFNHQQHNIMQMSKTQDKKLDNTISKTFRPGYTYNGKVVKDAMVEVFSLE